MATKIAEKQDKEDYRIETYCSLSSLPGVENQEHSLGGELSMLRERTAIITLDMLRKYLLKMFQSA
jgi:hypothetical protein